MKLNSTELTYLCFKPGTTCQVDSNEVSKPELKPSPCKCIINNATNITAPSQLSHKWVPSFGTPRNLSTKG